MCGDATKPEHVERLLDGAKPDLMVTDPPYGVNYDSSWRYRSGISSKDGAFGKSNERRPVRLDGRLCALPRFNRLRLDEQPRPSGSRSWARRLRLRPTLAHHLGQGGTSCRAEVTTTGDTSLVGMPSRRARKPTGRAGTKPRPSGRSTTPGNLKPATRLRSRLSACSEPSNNHKGDVYDPFVGLGTTIIAGE